MDAQIDAKNLLKTLPLQIADQLADAITVGDLAAGARLRETELATAYAVSRATVRESLRLLEQRGLVSIQPQRGVHVTQLSAKELHDLFAIRASLLSTASRLAAERCTRKEAAILTEKLAALGKNVGNRPAYINQSAALVDFITVMADNEILANYVRDLAQRIGRYVRIGLAGQERRERSLSVWNLTIGAIIAGKPEQASLNHYRLAMQNRDAALRQFGES
jgi:DNA-binding GntR family transcriptional regulator